MNFTNSMNFIRPKVINKQKNKPKIKKATNVFISIGRKCGVRYNIEKVIGKKETHFFDWLITDMKCVNAILKTNDIKNLINLSTVKKDKKNPYGFTKNTYRYHITSLSYCESLHDVPSGSGKQQELALVQRYVRRYNRLIKIIKNNNINIFFIRNGDINEIERNQFIKNILNHNSNCNFKLVECSYTTKSNSRYYTNINLNNYKIDTSRDIGDWKLTNFNWKNIFNEIKKIKVFYTLG